MTRTILARASVFGGTGADPFPADVAIEGERIVTVGPALDGDRAIDAGRQAVGG